MENAANNHEYGILLSDISEQILRSRYKAAKLVNRELLLLYFKVGKQLSVKIAVEGWGAKVVDQLSADLQKQIPGLRGFSRRNLFNMKSFAEEYLSLSFLSSEDEPHSEDHSLIVQLSTARLQDVSHGLFFGISFTHHVLLINRCPSRQERVFYMRHAAENSWTVEMLDWQIKAKLYHEQGRLANNFDQTLPDSVKATALMAFKDEYLLDFINIETEDERLVEKGIVQNIREFILKMGTGFSFVGNQYRLVVDQQEFFIDLLFFNRHLQCLVAVELKRGGFKPEYLGQLNFYVNVLNDQVKLAHENPSIGILMCKERSKAVVEYAFKGQTNPMGVATYQLTNDLPDHLRRILPDPEALRKLLG